MFKKFEMELAGRTLLEKGEEYFYQLDCRTEVCRCGKSCCSGKWCSTDELLDFNYFFGETVVLSTWERQRLLRIRKNCLW